MKHSSVNGLVDEQTVQEMYEMIVENSRRFLDTPSSTDAKALPAMEKPRIKAQDKGINKVSVDYACYGCGSSDHWIKDCPMKQAQNRLQQRTQFFQSRAQLPNWSNKTYSGKPPPRTQSQNKGKGKGKGKNKGKEDSRNLFQKGKGKGNNKVRPAARAIEWEDNPDYQDYADYPDEDQDQDQ